MKKLFVFFVLALMSMPLVVVAAGDQAVFEEILAPVMKIYDFVKYAATVLAMLYLVFAGVTYIMSGNEPAKREQAKMMAMYVIIGLIVIWAAPMLVEYLTQ